MKTITDFIIERGPVPMPRKKFNRKAHVEMVQVLLDQLRIHNDCKYDENKNTWTGKDAEIWKSATQFICDYFDELKQNELKDIIDEFGWKKWITDVNDINPQEVSMCISLELL